MATMYSPSIVETVNSQGTQWGSRYLFVPATVQNQTSSGAVETTNVTWATGSVLTSYTQGPTNPPSTAANLTGIARYATASGNTLKATPTIPAGYRFYGWLALRVRMSPSDTVKVFCGPGRTVNQSPEVWSTTNAGVLTVSSFMPPINSAYLNQAYAAVAISLAVTFNGNGGTIGGSSSSVLYGVISSLPTPDTRSGYVFNGWYTAATGGTRIGGAGDSYTPTADITLYAQWSPAYTIAFVADGGSGAPSAVTVAQGGTWTCPLDYPTLSGYTCKGWHTSPGETAPLYVAGESYTAPSANLTLYAVWAPNSGILIFDANGGSVSEGFRVLAVGQAYGSLPIPTRSGYNFTGWYTATTGGSQVTESTTKGSSSTETIYARWSQASRSHYLILNCMGGTVSGESTVLIQLSEGAAYGTLPTPARSGYTFVGWFTSTVGGSQISSSTTMGASNANAYAHWSAPEFTITFNANGGTTPEATRTVASGDSYGALPVPERIGFNFDGWHTAADGGSEISASDYPSASTTLYAHWSSGEALPFSISFS